LPKFKYGDMVRVNDHFGIIVSVIKEGSRYKCRVKWNNQELIPPEMFFYENEIKMIKPSREIRCTCGTEVVYGRVPTEAHSTSCDLRNVDRVLSEEKEFLKEDTERKIVVSEETLKEFEKLCDSNEEGDYDDEDFFTFGF